jgi:hypothetical protein
MHVSYMVKVSGVKGLELIDPTEGFAHQPKWLPMVTEKKDDRVGDPIKMLLEKDLRQ